MSATPSDIASWLKDQNDIVILTHLHPDGDALGASLALTLALRSLGKRACVCCQDEVPSFLNMLPWENGVYLSGDLPFAPQAFAFVDCAMASRVGKAASVLVDGLPLCCIDHHLTQSTPASPALINPNAAAAGELVCGVIDAMGVSLTRDMALCLYVAVATDTGNFSFDSTTPTCLEIAARCLKAGIDLAGTNLVLFRQRTPQRTRLLGTALHSMTLTDGGRLAVMRITQQDFAKCGASTADTEGIVNYGIDTEGVQIALLAVELPDGVKFSARSRGSIDVAAMLARLGGGGHAKAAGLTLNMPLAEAVDMVTALARETLNG